MGENQQSRFEKSLGLLTTKFVNLLQKSTGGVLDLKLVIEKLGLLSTEVLILYFTFRLQTCLLSDKNVEFTI